MLQSYDQQGIQLPQDNDNVEENDFLSGFDLSRLIHVGIKSWYWTLLILITTIFLSWIYVRYTKPVFQSSSVLKLESKNDASVLGLELNESQNNLRNLYGEIEFIKSRLVFEKALEKLDLNISYFVEGKILSEEKYNNSPFKTTAIVEDPAYYDLRFDITKKTATDFELSFTRGNELFEKKGHFGKPIVFPGISLLIEKTGTLSENYFFVINSKESLISYLEKNLDVQIVNADANTLKVSFTDHNPVKAKDIVDAIDEVYLQETIANKSKAEEQTLQFLEENLEATEAKLMSSENRLETFMKENKTLDVKTEVERVIEKIEDLDRLRVELRLNISKLDDLEEMVKSEKDLKTFSLGSGDLENSQLLDLMTELLDLQQQRELTLTRSKENTYVVKSLSLSIENLKQNILNSIRQNRKLLFQELANLSKQISNLEKQFLTLPGKETEFTRIKRFYDLYEKYYLMLMEKKAEFGIAKAGMVPNFVVLSPAQVSHKPVFPNKVLIYSASVASGFFFSVVLIFLLYFLNNTVTSQKELERSVHCTFLGGVPEYSNEKLEVSNLIIQKNPKSQISEAFRAIRTNLEFIDAHKGPKIISVTSTVSGEGKTFVTLNLAGIIALSGQKVIILDLDMRRPKIHRAFNQENIAGMSNLLINKKSIEECTLHTGFSDLDFIPAGPPPPNPSELILRPEFEKLLAQLKERYDLVIIDTPPVGLVTDAVLVMRHANIPLFIARANYSKKTVSNTINKLVKTTGFTKLCVIMNAVKSINSYGYGGYGYTGESGYGYYEEIQQEPDKIFTKVKSLFKI